MRILSMEEMEHITAGGVGITLASVLAVLAAAVIAIVVYKLFLSKKGSAQLPGGWKFTWN